jgi:hypothetical protein
MLSFEFWADGQCAGGFQDFLKILILGINIWPVRIAHKVEGGSMECVRELSGQAFCF